MAGVCVGACRLVFCTSYTCPSRIGRLYRVNPFVDTQALIAPADYSVEIGFVAEVGGRVHWGKAPTEVIEEYRIELGDCDRSGNCGVFSSTAYYDSRSAFGSRVVWFIGAYGEFVFITFYTEPCGGLVGNNFPIIVGRHYHVAETAALLEHQVVCGKGKYRP